MAIFSEEVYVTQPPGFAVKGSEGKVCRLKRALCGLKQAPQAWYAQTHLHLLHLYKKIPNSPTETILYIQLKDSGILFTYSLCC